MDVLHGRMEKRLDGNYTRMLRAILNKSWTQHPTKQQLYSHHPPITKTIKIRWTRYAGHCWGSRDELISAILPWTSSHGQAKAGRPARTYIQQLCTDTGCSPADLPGAMDDIRADSAIWWWWFNKYFDIYFLNSYRSVWLTRNISKFNNYFLFS